MQVPFLYAVVAPYSEMAPPAAVEVFVPQFDAAQCRVAIEVEDSTTFLVVVLAY